MSEPNSIPAFCRAAAANPDDDLCRLVFADWLEENNDDGFDVPCPCNQTPNPGRLVQPVGPPGGSLSSPCPTCNGSLRKVQQPNGFASVASLIRVQTELRNRGTCSVCGFKYMVHDLSATGKNFASATMVNGVRVNERAEPKWNPLCRGCLDLLVLEMNAAVGSFRSWLIPIAEDFDASSLYVGRRRVPIKLQRVGGSAVSFWGGFPEGVIDTLEHFYGDEVECSRCGEGAEDSPPMDWETGVTGCERCDSTGLVFQPGYGRLVVTEYPVKAFGDPDRNARRLRGQGEGNGWAWDDEDGAPVGLTESGLPSDIFERLKAHAEFLWASASDPRERVMTKTYAKPSHAIQAFSAAVLDAVRDQTK